MKRLGASIFEGERGDALQQESRLRVGSLEKKGAVSEIDRYRALSAIRHPPSAIRHPPSVPSRPSLGHQLSPTTILVIEAPKQQRQIAAA